MSLELHVFLTRANLPDRLGWQKAIDAIGFPVQLDPALDPISNIGFSPVGLGEIESGFELYHDGIVELLSLYPQLHSAIADRDVALSFRWKGNLIACGCVLVAATALIKSFGGIAYSANDDVIYKDYQQLLNEARQCF